MAQAEIVQPEPFVSVICKVKSLKSIDIID